MTLYLTLAPFIAMGGCGASQAVIIELDYTDEEAEEVPTGQIHRLGPVSSVEGHMTPWGPYTCNAPDICDPDLAPTQDLSWALEKAFH